MRVIVEHHAAGRRHEVTAGERRVVVPRAAPVVLRTARTTTVQLPHTTTFIHVIQTSSVLTGRSRLTAVDEVRTSSTTFKLRRRRSSVMSTFPMGCHCHCVWINCACAVSGDVRLGDKFLPHIWNPWPRFVYSLCNFYGSAMKINRVIRQNSVRPRVKGLAAVCARSRMLWTRRSMTSERTLLYSARLWQR